MPPATSTVPSGSTVAVWPWRATIIGATSMAQLKTNIDAFDLDWTDELEKAVNAIHVAQPNPCP